uniref:ANK_REP_REGION domain-containing protein n=1 Tax=Parastrongyloides trichosuri TaxID=131310 RepID=A0A0N4Z2Y9_PARTI
MRRQGGKSARRDPQAALRPPGALSRGVVRRVATLVVQLEGANSTGALTRAAYAPGPRHGAVGVAPAVAVQTVAPRAEAIGSVAIAVGPGRVLRLAEAQVQRAVLAQRQRDRRAEVLVAASADPGADLAVHPARRGLFPGVGPGLDGRRIGLALADPAGNLLFRRQTVRRRRLKRHGGRGVADRRGQGVGARGRHGARTSARRRRHHALGITARQQEGGGHEFDQHTHLLPFTSTLTPNAAKRLAFGHETERDRVDAIAQARRRRAVGEDVALMTVATGAARLDPHHAVAVVAHGADVSWIDGFVEAGPAGAALELGPRAEQGQAAFAAAKDPCPFFAQQGSAKGRLGAVGQKHALLFRREVGLQRHALAVGRRRQVIAGGRAHRGGGFGLGHDLKIGSAGRSFHRAEQAVHPSPHGRFVGRVAGIGQGAGRGVGRIVAALARRPGLMTIAEIGVVGRQTQGRRLDEDGVLGRGRAGDAHVRQAAQQVQRVQAAARAAGVDQHDHLALHRVGGAGVRGGRAARHDEGRLTGGDGAVEGGDNGLGLLDHRARFLDEARVRHHAVQGVGEPLTIGGGGAIGDLARFRLAADGELRRPDAVGQAIAARGGVERRTVGAAQVQHKALRPANSGGLGFDLGEEGVPGRVIGQGVDVDPRAAVHRLDRQRRARRRIDRGAIGGFQVLRRGRLRRQGEIAGAAADLELAGSGHARRHRVVAVPQQIGRAADAAGLGRQVTLELVQLGLGQIFDRLGVAALEHGAQ